MKTNPKNQGKVVIMLIKNTGRFDVELTKANQFKVIDNLEEIMDETFDSLQEADIYVSMHQEQEAA